MEGFVQDISKRRKEASTAWIESIEALEENIPSMPTIEADRFYTGVNNPPPIVTESHLKRAASVAKKIGARLEALKVEWLLEKFKELPTSAKNDFLRKAQTFIVG